LMLLQFPPERVAAEIPWLRRIPQWAEAALPEFGVPGGRAGWGLPGSCAGSGTGACAAPHGPPRRPGAVGAGGPLESRPMAPGLARLTMRSAKLRSSRMLPCPGAVRRKENTTYRCRGRLARFWA
jgi:hypothetical protein